jgi:hypothetical protein
VDLPVRPVVAVTERQLQADVEGQLMQLEDRGVVWHHCPDPRRCHGPRGLPDLVIAGPGGLVLAELKSADGELSAEQQAWQWALQRGRGVTSHRLWRPADLSSGRIRSQLALLSG